jgi:hypothetical protein
MNVHLDLAVTEDALKSQSGNGIDGDDDVEDDEEDDDDETGVGGEEVQEVVAAGLFDWMGLSSAPVPAPVTVTAAGGRRALDIVSETPPHRIISLHHIIFHLINLHNVIFQLSVIFYKIIPFLTASYSLSLFLLHYLQSPIFYHTCTPLDAITSS